MELQRETLEGCFYFVHLLNYTVQFQDGAVLLCSPRFARMYSLTPSEYSSRSSPPQGAGRSDRHTLFNLVHFVHHSQQIATH